MNLSLKMALPDCVLRNAVEPRHFALLQESRRPVVSQPRLAVMAEKLLNSPATPRHRGINEYNHHHDVLAFGSNRCVVSPLQEGTEAEEPFGLTKKIALLLLLLGRVGGKGQSPSQKQSEAFPPPILSEPSRECRLCLSTG